MDPYLLGAVICGVIFLGIIGLIFGASYFTNDEQKNSEIDQDSDNEQRQTIVQTPTYQLTIQEPPPTFSFTVQVPPMMPRMPYLPSPPYQASDEEWEKYSLQKAKYDEDLEEYLIKKAKYDEAMKAYTVSSITTVRYGGMTLSTDELELKIHDLINNERAKHDLNQLSYDYKISNIAHSHSSDMNVNDYFDHEDPKGVGPAERGFVYGYSECGDKATIQLGREYDRLLQQFEATGNTDVVMYNQLEKMRNQINSAVEQGIVFGGLSENIAQNNLYNQYWTTDGVITSYDWISPDEIAKSTVDGWMNSTGHRHNILTPYYTTEGIGVSISSDYKVYITQNFC